MAVDPRTPIIVGVGQFTERIDDPAYRGMSAVELAAAAAEAALADTGKAGAVAAAVDTVVGIRQFEISGRGMAPLGCSTNYPRSVARRIGAAPARAVLEPIGGQGPQRALTEFAGVIAAGAAEVVMVFGSENGSTLRSFSDRSFADRSFADRSDRPDHSETVEGQLEDRGYGYEGLFDDYTVAHGLVGAPAQYGLLENARRGRVGLGVTDYRRAMAELFAPFSAVAAGNPFSASPVRRSVTDILTIDAGNRMICDPYPRLLVARDQVNQGAAVVLMSVAAARALGVPPDRWVYLRGHADVVDQSLLDRADLSFNSASILAVREALAVAGVGLDDIATFDLYSCFPVPVFNFCDGMGLATDDPRGLTLTGGLPYFGGPGNNYSLHAIAETAMRMRSAPGAFGLVAANGGIMSKYSVGVYSTEPADWAPGRGAELSAEVAARPRVGVAVRPQGSGTVETYTVRYDWPERTGIVIGRLDADGSRFLTLVEDPDLLGLLSEGDPLGARIAVRPGDNGNRAVAG